LELHEALPCFLEIFGYNAFSSLNLGQAFLYLDLLGVFGILVHAPSDFLFEHDSVLLHVVDFGFQLRYEELRIVHLVGNLIQRSKSEQFRERRVVFVDTTKATAVGHVALQKVDEILQDATSASRASGTHCRPSGTGGHTGHQIGENLGQAIVAGIVLGILLVVVGHVISPIGAGSRSVSRAA